MTTPTYIEESDYGFRYRLLGVSIHDGFEAAAKELLPGEKLYRMMDGAYRVQGKLFPVLMENKINFDQSTAMMRSEQWRFKIAAGIHEPINYPRHSFIEEATNEQA